MAKPSAPVGMVGYDPVAASLSLSLNSFYSPPASTTTLKAQVATSQSQSQVQAAPPSPCTRTANKGERRRSLPPASAVVEEQTQTQKQRPKPRQMSERPAKTNTDMSAPSLYERRRNASVMSPSLTVNTVSTVSRGGSPPASTGRSMQSQPQSDRSQRSATSDIFAVNRLRSNSGLSLHTNSAALRRYIDYNADGSSRLSPTREKFAQSTQSEKSTKSSKSEKSYKSDGSASLDGRTLDDSQSQAQSQQSFAGLFAWETVRAVLDHPVARERLWAYTRATGGTENLEFLEKVEEYARALHGVTALMANISTKFTCVTATDPLKLPTHLAKALNTDVKHVSSSILPGLEMLFGDVNAHIKDRVLRHIYPEFAKHQLGLRMKVSLGASSAGAAESPYKFAGLGRAFCLTDPYRPDNPIVYASDSFAHLLGYDRAEQIPRTGRFFRGPEPSQSEKNQEQFTEELVLSRNHRDNRPFWSLVSVCPLKNASGRVRFILSGLVDVTDAVKSQHDIVHALSVQPSSTNPVPPEAKPSNFDDRRMSVMSTYDMPAPFVTVPAPVVNGKKLARPESRTEKTAKKFFFKGNPFSRRRKASVAVDDASSARSSSRAGKVLPTPSTTLTACVDAGVSPRAGAATPSPMLPPTPGLPSSIRPASLVLPTDLLATYSRFMVLQYVPGTNPDTAYDPEAVLLQQQQRRGGRYGSVSQAPAPQTPQTSSGSVSRLKVAFSSIPMLELLGLGPAAQDAVMYHDVFAVLSELAGSPSITPVFRANVRQRIVTSESASLELFVPAASSGVPGLTGAPGALSAGLGAGLASPLGMNDEYGSAPASTSRRSSLLLGGRRLSRQEARRDSRHEEGDALHLNLNVPRATKGREPRMQRLMSHWTPLKDVDGSVAWVILVMSPVVE